MTISIAHAFLVRPQKGSDTLIDPHGSEIGLSGRIFDLLNGIYMSADKDCDIDIAFVPKNGMQTNDCRDLVCAYLRNPTIETARPIAIHLQRNTDGRSGLGLLFLVRGQHKENTKLVISRFPTNEAISVSEKNDSIDVQFLERVFMKNRSSYKAVMYEGSSIESDFWDAKAVDKQINNLSVETSNYWIADFLQSHFKTTPAAGTKRLAITLRNASKKADLETRREIVAAATLASGLKGSHLSINEFCDKFSLSKNARKYIFEALPNQMVASERFYFDSHVFRDLISFRSIELDNGAIITAPAESYNKIVRKEKTSTREKDRFIIEGNIINEKIRSDAS